MYLVVHIVSTRGSDYTFESIHDYDLKSQLRPSYPFLTHVIAILRAY